MRLVFTGWRGWLLSFFVLISHQVVAQNDALNAVFQQTDTTSLHSWSANWALSAKERKAAAMKRALERGWPLRITDSKTGQEAELIKLAPWGEPLYAVTDNRISARTIGTWRLRPGGDLGLGLRGTNLPIGIWDGGAVRATHQELTGRVTQVDGVTTLNAHATHVAGTLMAAGIDTNARGMAFGALLRAYDWNSDDAEMAAAAASGLLLSNHSYGWISGWYNGTSTNGTTNFWYGWEPLSTVEDYKFGYYDEQAVAWDQVADAAPFYLICKAAGNDRGEARTAGTSHNVQDSVSPFGWRLSTLGRNADGNSNGYDCITGGGVAKNILTVGSVSALPNGYTTASAVTLAASSGNGPTDDGRIKPDVVSQGVGVYSTTSTSNTAYTTLSGTSMASPGAAGSLLLLQERYQQLKGRFMRSSSLKGLAIHTADEAGPSDGPDYRFGWGLMNMGKAAQLLQADGQSQHLVEDSIQNGQNREIRFYSDGSSPVRLTLCWTDPAGASPVYPDLLDNPNSLLVHDLDMRLIQESNNQVQLPWILNPANPASAATKGDNFRDNVEQIVVQAPTAGWYVARISHKSWLQNTQRYSLVVSGLTLPAIPPSAAFQVSDNNPCQGQTIQFEALDSAAGSTYSWFFPGGSPATGNSRIIQVSYAQNGNWPIQLVVSRNGQQDTSASSIRIGGIQPPLIENFEQSSHALEIQNPDAGSSTWQIDSIAYSPNGSKSMMMPFYIYSQKGQNDYLVLPLLNLSGQNSARLSFDHAYTRYPTELSDTLKVQVSVGCNNLWATVAEFSEGGNGSFATTGGSAFSSSTNFSPTANNEWCGSSGFSNCKEVNLDAYAGQAAVKVRFATVNQYGNNLYLDNLKITAINNNNGITLSDTICEGQYRLFDGDTLRTTGIYQDTLVNVSGGDSIITLQLTVNAKSFNSFSISICQGQSYFFNGSALTEAGNYLDTLTNAVGCDSLLQLQLSLREVKRDSSNASICQGKTFLFGTRALNTSGWYSDTLTASNGCDSIRIVWLEVKPTASVNIQATICEGSQFSFGTRQLTIAGTYTDSLTGVNGCDSIVQLVLSVKPNGNTSLQATRCAGETYTFGTRLLTQSGNYTDTLPSANGCDSIIQLSLTILPASTSGMSATRCEGQSYFFNGLWLNQAGNYRDTLLNSNGCDSIIQLSLAILPTSTSGMSATRCEGQSYFFNGQWLNQAGNYRDTLISSNGCDSIVTLQLNFLPRSVGILTLSLCQGDSMFLGGSWIKQAGIYRDTLVNQLGCDSIRIITLEIKPTAFVNIQATICEGSQFSFGTRHLTIAGTYSDSLTGVNGCDSIVQLVLSVKPNVNTSLQATRCAGETYSFGTRLLTQAGNYTDTIPSANGCDSIIQLSLIFLPASTSSMSALQCQGQSYFFNGQWLDLAGNYRDTLVSSNGCDSIVTLQLIFLPRSAASQTLSLCQGDSVFFGGRWIKQAGVYHDTLANHLGCDSIISLQVNQLNLAVTTLSASFCEGKSFLFGNKQIQTPGVYRDTLPGSNGCDSVVVLQLQELSRSSTSLSKTVCPGQQFNFNGRLLSMAGLYSDTLINAKGCDSIISLQLQIQSVPITNLQAGICPGSSYWFDGQSLQQPGSYRDTLSGSFGCDSIVVLTLTQLQTTTSQVNAQVCAPQRYWFGGSWLSQSGTYSDTLTNSVGCDSIITLSLHVTPAISSLGSAILCAGKSLVFGSRVLTQTGRYTDTLTGTNGCDSIVILDLLVFPAYGNVLQSTICAGSSYVFGNRVLQLAGTYYDTLVSSTGCDSIIQLDLTLLPLAVTNLQQTLCQGQSLNFNGQIVQTAGIFRDTLVATNGCDSIITLQVQILNPQFANLTASICPGGSYTFHNVTLTQPGTYRDTLSASNGCDSIITLSLGLKQPSYSQILDSVCLGKTYLFGNRPLTQAGIYRDTLMAANGCDSIVTLTLSTKNGVQSNQVMSVCFGDSVFVNGGWIKSSQILQITSTASNGCDSIHTIDIQFRSLILSSLVRNLCQGQIFNFNGQILSQSGTYRDTLNNTNGCDSIISLTLNINPNPAKPTITRTGNDLVSSALIGNQWYHLGTGGINGATGVTYTPTHLGGGQYWVTATSAFGCTSTPSDTFAFVGTVASSLQNDEWLFFPNPGIGNLTSVFFAEKGDSYRLSIYDLSGRLLKILTEGYGEGRSLNQTFTLPDLASGTYVLQLQTKKGVKTGKWVIQK